MKVEHYTIFDYFSHEHNLPLLESELDEIMKIVISSSWETVEEFQQQANEGWCWIVYNGRVTEAYHDNAKMFRFHRMSDNVFMTECISWVMPWIKPSAPNLEISTAQCSQTPGFSARTDTKKLHL